MSTKTRGINGSRATMNQDEGKDIFLNFIFSSKSYTFLSTSNIAIVKNHTHTHTSVCAHTAASKGREFLSS